MSASPSDRTPNQTPNGTLPPLKRRPKPAVDPLVRPKDRNKKPYRPLPASGTAINGVNGSRRLQGPTSSEQRPAHAIPPRAKTPPGDSTKSSTIVDVDAAAHSGFSSKPIAPYTDFPLIISKRKLAEGLRFHVAKFISKKTIDPRDDNQFVKPLRLHRRDPQAGPGGAGVIKGHEVDSKDGLLNDKERAQQEILRAQREAERAAEMAQVAPATHTGNQKRSSKFQKKTQQVFRKDQTEEQKESAKLRYEESIPWVLEDFDNKQTWVGGYEAALSKTYAQFVQKDDKFYVTPIEKWYKFTPKTPYNVLSIEAAEDLLKQKHKDPKWLQEQMRANREKKEEMQNRKATSGLYVGKSDRPTADNIAIKGEDEDARELDFDDVDMFADDEENDIFEGVEKEDKDEIAKRVRKDMLSANVFDLKDEKEYTAAEILERKTKQEHKQFGKKTKKALFKLEKNLIYNTDDSDSNPYESESDSEDTETETLKEEQLKKEAEEKNSATGDKSKVPSNSSTKGTNTPSNRPNYSSDSLHKVASPATLKRPGSPNLSEASGNESSRPKKQKKNATSSSLNTGTATPNGPPSRPRSPALPPTSSTDTARPQIPRKPSKINNLTVLSSEGGNKRPRGAGSGTDGEGAGSGGETSDGARKKKKIKGGSHLGTPHESRAGSPAPNGGRAASPALTTAKFPPPFPTAAEIKAQIPKSGTTVNAILAPWRPIINDEERKQEFSRLLRTISNFNKETRILTPMD